MIFNNIPNKKFKINNRTIIHSRSIAVCIILIAKIEDKNYILLTKRQIGQVEENKIANVSGYLDWNESIQQCITRELNEEVGIDITEKQFRKNIIYGSLDKPWKIHSSIKNKNQVVVIHYRIAYSLKELPLLKPQLKEISICSWVQFSKLKEVFNQNKFAWDTENDIKEVIKEYFGQHRKEQELEYKTSYFIKRLEDCKDNLEEIVLQEIEGINSPQIASDIAINNIPEVPYDDKKNKIEEDEDENQDDDIDSFLKKIGLYKTNEEATNIALIRFEELLEDYEVDDDAKNLFIYLLHKAKFNKEDLTEKEIDELLSLIESMKNKSKKEKKEESYYLEKGLDKEQKTGSVALLIGLTLLGGIGGLLVGGLIVGAAYMSDDKWNETKENFTDEDTKEDIKEGKISDEKIKEIKKESEKAEIKNKDKDLSKLSPKAQKKIDKLQKKIDKIKNHKSIFKKIEDKKNEIIGKIEDKKNKIKNRYDMIKQVAKGEFDKDVDPQEYHKKHGRCPVDWKWDSEKNKCVLNKG